MRESPAKLAQNISLREHARTLKAENVRLRSALVAAERTAQVERARAEAAEASVKIWARVVAQR